MMRHRAVPWLAASFALLAAAVPRPAPACVGAPDGLVYANDRLFHTVGAPSDLPPTGPFDRLYQLGTGLAPVSHAGPGDRGFHGGRWEVHPVTFVTIAPRQFSNARELYAAAGRGEISIGPAVRRFECAAVHAARDDVAGQVTTGRERS